MPLFKMVIGMKLSVQELGRSVEQYTLKIRDVDQCLPCKTRNIPCTVFPGMNWSQGTLTPENVLVKLAYVQLVQKGWIRCRKGEKTDQSKADPRRTARSKSTNMNYFSLQWQNFLELLK